LFRKKPGGFTLIELMITVAVISIIAVIAMPLYRGYIESARKSVLTDNIQTIRLMQDDRRIDLGEYVEGVFDPKPGGVKTLAVRLGWDPRKNRDVAKYEVICIADSGIEGECASSSGYTVTAIYYEVSGDPKQYIETDDQVARTYTPSL